MPEPQSKSQSRNNLPKLPPAHPIDPALQQLEQEARQSWLKEVEAVSKHLRSGQPIAEAVDLIQKKFQSINPELASKGELERWVLDELLQNQRIVSIKNVGPIEHDWFAKVAILNELNPEFVETKNLRQENKSLSLKELAFNKLSTIISNTEISKQDLTFLDLRALQHRYRLFDWARGLTTTLSPEIAKGKSITPLYQGIIKKREEVVKEVLSRPREEILDYVNLHLEESKLEPKEKRDKTLLDHYEEKATPELRSLTEALRLLSNLDFEKSPRTGRLTLNLLDEEQERPIPLEVELSLTNPPILTFRHPGKDGKKGQEILTLEAENVANPWILRLNGSKQKNTFPELPRHPVNGGVTALAKHERLEAFLLEAIKYEKARDEPGERFTLANYDIPREGETLHIIVSPRYSGDLSPLDNFGAILLNAALSGERKMQMRFIYSNTPLQAMERSVRDNKQEKPEIKHILRSIYVHGTERQGLAFEEMLNEKDFLKLLEADEKTPSTNRTIACFAGGMTLPLLKHLKGEHAHKAHKAAFFFETSALTPNFLGFAKDGGLTLSVQEMLLIKYLLEDKTLNFGEAFMKVDENTRYYRPLNPQAIINGKHIAREQDSGPSEVMRR